MQNLTDGLNQKQLQAVTTLDGPIMIIAGAGSGKTRVITLKIANLLANHIPESQILALTFSNKAANEMQERVQTLCSGEQPTISTFHSFGYSLIAKFANKLGISKKISIYNTSDQIQLIKELLKLKSYPTLFANKKNEVNAYVQQQHISLLKNNLLPEIYQSPDIVRLRKDYDDALQAYHALDFDDLILKPIALFQDSSVQEMLHQQYKYFLVDEFQDTSSLQFEILHNLAKNSKNISVVGDDDQSIYSWRGADLKNWDRFAQAFPNYSEVILDTSYRCSPTILKAANAIIAKGERSREKTLQSHQSTQGAQDNPIHIVNFNDEQQEAACIGDMIHIFRYQYDIPWSEIGILTRTNNLFNPFEVVLNQSQIPYTVSGGSSFFEHIEIKDLLSYLRVINNPKDNISFRRIINTPKRGLGITGINYISDFASQNNISLFEACVHCSAGAIEKIPKATQLNCYDLTQIILEASQKLAQGISLPSCLKDIIAHTNYMQYLRENYHNQAKLLAWKEDNIDRLISIIEQYDTKRMDSNDILNALSYKMLQDTKELDDAVALMTIHAAKGLEKEVIFIAGMEQGIMPHNRSIEENPAQIHEETRLCYVAITRAKSYLILSRAENRKNKRTQKIQVQYPSPYLSYIPQDIITHDLPTVDNSKEALQAQFDQLTAMIENS